HLRASGLPDPGGALPRHHPAAAGRGGAAHRDPSLEHPDPRGRRRHHRHRGARVRARRPARLRDRGRLRPRAQGREAARRAGGADYGPEYGSARVENPQDSFPAGARALMAYDLVAAGGAAAATLELARRFDVDVLGATFLSELVGLGGRDRLPGTEITTIWRIED